jgi:branched-chain amino acid transport system permease protein
MTLSTIAMVLVGGIGRWYGSLIGALILASIQQVLTVTVSSELNLFAVGIFLLAFVLWAPKGLVGFITRMKTNKNSVKDAVRD